MIRALSLSLILAGSIAGVPMSQAGAQSPDPARIAPGSSGAAIAPRTFEAPSPQTPNVVPSPGGNAVQAPSGTTPQGSDLSLRRCSGFRRDGSDEEWRLSGRL
jgi:hypothetical protein